MRTRALVGLTAMFMLSGCGALLRAANPTQPVKVEHKLLGEARAATQPAQVKVLTQAQDLPAGFFYQRQAKATKLWAMPDYPTAEAPHQVIAGIGWTGGAYGALPDEVTATAARLGANALLRLPQRTVAYAIWLSEAPAPTDWPEPAGLIAKERAAMPGFTDKGEPSTAPMNALAPLAVPVKRGRCYGVAAALSADATWGAAAQRMVSGQVKSGDALIGNRSTQIAETYDAGDGFEMKAPYHGKLVRLRAFHIPIGCAWADGEVAVGVEAAGRSTVLGTGTLHLQVVSKKISEAELAEKKARRDVAMAKAKAESEAFARREAERRALEAERRARDAEQRAKAAEAKAKTRRSAPSGPGHFSLSLKNTCPRTVKLFEGDKPKWGSGTYSSIGPNTIRSFSGFAGKTLWIVDDGQNGVSSYALTAGSHNVKITPSCSGFAPR